MPAGLALRVPDWSALRRRGAGIVLALVAEALLVLMLLTMAPYAGRRPGGGGPALVTFDLPSQRAEQATTQPKTARNREQAAATPPPRPMPPPPPVEPPVVPWRLPPGVIELPPEVYAAADIGKLPRREQAPAAAADGGGSPGAAGMPGDSATVGTAPNGEPLYAAEWVREPTHAELAFYLPKRQIGPGFGMIACRTVARFKVEDCVPLGETPGTGLAYSVQQAAWQFLVRPPRVGGKAQVGTVVALAASQGRPSSAATCATAATSMSTSVAPVAAAISAAWSPLATKLSPLVIRAVGMSGSGISSAAKGSMASGPSGMAPAR
jgi:hypothetical protein